MTSDVLIEARKIGLAVPVIKPQERSILANPASLLTDFYWNSHSRHPHILLQDVSFTLRCGEKLAVIGANGSGKTTLLRLLAGIYRPSNGSLSINCAPRGLFDIALGFVGEATGLENIYLRGLEMGLPVARIRELIPQIMEFSELGEQIDKPLVSFSTGMRLRLAVAISLAEQPDVMLMDEWIGSGDASFQGKVANRMNELVAGSRGLILASHSENLLRTVCTHGLVLSKGRVVFLGTLDQALENYGQSPPSSPKRHAASARPPATPA